MTHAIIYQLTSPTGRIYVGQTRHFRARMSYYRRVACKRQPLLYKSLLKYGFDAHRVDEIVTMNIYNLEQDQARIDFWEDWLLEKYKRMGVSVLNVKGAGRFGVLSDDTKRKISEIKKGTKLSDEVKAAMSLARKGRKKSLEHRRNIGLANTNNPKMSLATRGERNNKAKLTESQVKEIRSRHQINKKGQNIALAKEFGVSVSTIERISSKSSKTKSWLHI